MKEFVVAVVGATGVVGKEMIKTLEQRNFPVKTLVPLASERSLGTQIQYKDHYIDVKVLKEDSFEGVDYALFSAGGSISEKYVPFAVNSGAVCIDNTSFYRMHDTVPLVVPEVNAHDLKWHKGIIANPNCSTAQMIIVLDAINKVSPIKRVVVSTYQSVSGAGKEAIEELESQCRANLSGAYFENTIFSHPIAFNVIPQIDKFDENGYTKEELKMVNETKKILGKPSFQLTATAVRVPVFIGHSEAINIETETKLSAKEVRAILEKTPGVEVMDDPATQTYPTAREIAEQDPVFVGRIREDISIPNGIELWCVADNLRKGAALNAVQIAEELIK